MTSIKRAFAVASASSQKEKKASGRLLAPEALCERVAGMRMELVAGVAAVAAASTTIATATATSAETTTTTASIFARFSFVDVQRTSINLMAVKLLNRRIAFFFGRHFHEGKASGATGFAVFNNRC